MRKRILLGTVVCAALMTAAMPAAATPASGGGLVEVGAEASTTDLVGTDAMQRREVSLAPDSLCTEIRKMEAQRGDSGPFNCSAEVTLAASQPQVATDAMIRRDGGLVAADGTSLAKAAQSATIYYQEWSQEMRGLYYVNWVERHRGGYYFDRTRAWQSPRYGWDTSGFHYCDLGYGILYDIKVTS